MLIFSSGAGVDEGPSIEDDEEYHSWYKEECGH